MIHLPDLRRLSPTTSALMTMALLCVACVFIALHIRAVRAMSEIGLPAALALPRIEQKAALLAEQNEVAQLQAALRGGSIDETVRVYVLPAREEVDRLLALFDVLFGYLEQKRMLFSFSAVTVGEKIPYSEGLSALPISFDVVVTPDGLSRVMDTVDLAGLLTVSDALTHNDIDAILTVTEQENPASVAALEHFLSTDLLRYAQDPSSYENQLRGAFSPASEHALQSLFNTSRLRRARALYGELGDILRTQELWPLRIMTIEKTSSSLGDNGRIKLSLMLHAYVREE